MKRAEVKEDRSFGNLCWAFVMKESWQNGMAEPVNGVALFSAKVLFEHRNNQSGNLSRFEDRAFHTPWPMCKCSFHPLHQLLPQISHKANLNIDFLLMRD